MKIRTGDKVIVVSGKDRGKTGKVIRAIPDEEKVVIEDINIVKKHQQSRKREQKGQIVDRPMPVHVSNVMLVDPKEGVPTRVGFHVNENGKKVRIAKKSGTVLKK